MNPMDRWVLKERLSALLWAVFIWACILMALAVVDGAF